MNIELALMAVMLKTGDFTPLIGDDIGLEHFETIEGQTLYTFCKGYRGESGGEAQWPSLNIVRSRFKGTLELPDPDPGDTVANLAHELRGMKYRSDVRQVSAKLDEIAASADDPVEKVAEAIAKLRVVTEKHQRLRKVSFEQDLYRLIQRYLDGEVVKPGIPYPWPGFAHTKGIKKGEFVVIVGRPKSRKTFTALRIGVHALKHHHARILVFSTEMNPELMHLRCVAHLADLPYQEFKDGSLSEADEARLFEYAEMYGRCAHMTDSMYEFHLKEKIPGLGDTYPTLVIVHSVGQDVGWMQSQIELHKPTLVIADSFYKQRANNAKKNDTDWKAVTALSREMKEMAEQCQVPIIGTHQLNRGTDKGGLGDFSTIAFADAIGQDADTIINVATGKIEGEDVSALYVIGNRESKFEGIIIRNIPCYDYSEIGTITSKKQVEALLKQEAEEEEKEQREELEKQSKANGIRRKAGRDTSSLPTSRFTQELQEAEERALGSKELLS